MFLDVEPMSIRAAFPSECPGRWWEYRREHYVIQANILQEVPGALRKVESLVKRNKWHAVGFVSYEAAPAFDKALKVISRGDFPLLWFAFFDQPKPISLSESTGQALYKIGPWYPEISEDVYHRSLAAIRERIQLGETYQVNYTFRLRSSLDGNPWDLFLDTLRQQETPHSCYIETDKFSICSASPELFFYRTGDDIEMRPMKGTIPRGRNLEEDRENQSQLRISDKDRAENLMIVDMVRNDVSRIAKLGSVQVPSMFDLERYKTVHQMTSTVRAKTAANLKEVMQAIFPCASVTGAPKVSTMEIIRGLEVSPRKIYTGTLGVLRPDGSAHFNVAIRTILVDKTNGAAEYGVGSGIVWDSDSELEHRECMVKAKVLSTCEPDFSLLESLLWDPETGYSLFEGHLKRLRDSADYFDIPLDIKVVKRHLKHFPKQLPREPHKVRILVSKRGVVECEAAPVIVNKKPLISLRLAKNPIDSSNPFLFHKTTNRGVYDKAMECHLDCDDVVLWNERNEVTEGTRGNLAFEMEGKLWTPPLASGLLLGTYRQFLIDQGRLSERIIQVQDLAECSQIFWMNSVRGFCRATLCDKSIAAEEVNIGAGKI